MLAVLDGFGVLPRSARWIGHYPIRVRGTFGGSIAHADAASEWCLLAVLLDARIVLRSLDGERTLPATEFFLGLYETAADPEKSREERRHQPCDRGDGPVRHPHLYIGVMHRALAVFLFVLAACGPGDGAPQRTFTFGSSASPSAPGRVRIPSASRSRSA